MTREAPANTSSSEMSFKLLTPENALISRMQTQREIQPDVTSLAERDIRIS